MPAMTSINRARERERGEQFCLVPDFAPRWIPASCFHRRKHRCADPYPGSNVPIFKIASVDERPYICMSDQSLVKGDP
jgi:hypothetical protein